MVVTVGEGDRVVGRGAHLELLDRGGWEFVRRLRGRGVVVMVAVTDERELVLVEQHRPPFGAPVIELPAGLVGDDAGAETESEEDAARRELIEETGYEAARLQRLAVGATSPGLCDEQVVLFLATGLTRVDDGGGVASEEISVHRVPVDEVEHWLATQEARGAVSDIKVVIGSCIAREWVARRGSG